MERLSALMDGELDPEHIARSIDSTCDDQRWRKNWDTYHVIGDCLRQEALVDCEVSAMVMEGLSHEPTVVAPRKLAASSIRPRIALAVAASAAGVALVAWIAFMHNPLLPPQAVVAVAPVQPLLSGGAKSKPARPASNSEYLTAHQQVSPSTVVRGVASYVYTVSANESEVEHQ